MDTSAYLVLSTTRLPSALREALGPPAAEDLLTIVDEMRAERAEFRDEMRAERAEFRGEMRVERAEFRAGIRADFAEFRREMQVRFEAIDARFDRVDQRFQVLETRLGDVKADLMKWSFVFWVGAVTAIAMLAGVLER